MLRFEYKLTDPTDKEKYGKEYVKIIDDKKEISYESCGSGWIKQGRDNNEYVSAFISFDDGERFNFTILSNKNRRDDKDPAYIINAKIGEDWQTIGGLWDFRRMGTGWSRGSFTLNSITYGMAVKQYGTRIGKLPSYVIFVEEDMDTSKMRGFEDERMKKQPPTTKADMPENVKEFTEAFDGVVEDDGEIPF